MPTPCGPSLPISKGARPATDEFGASRRSNLRQSKEASCDAEAQGRTREQWSAARKGLLEREQELGKLDEELAKQRQELPWVAVEKEYTFDTEEGKKTLAELFDGRSH